MRAASHPSLLQKSAAAPSALNPVQPVVRASLPSQRPPLLFWLLLCFVFIRVLHSGQRMATIRFRLMTVGLIGISPYGASFQTDLVSVAFAHLHTRSSDQRVWFFKLFLDPPRYQDQQRTESEMCVSWCFVSSRNFTSLAPEPLLGTVSTRKCCCLMFSTLGGTKTRDFDPWAVDEHPQLLLLPLRFLFAFFYDTPLGCWWPSCSRFRKLFLYTSAARAKCLNAARLQLVSGREIK